ncbi:hypothetical protein NNC19_03995 [Clostridium sp. SHJSY1]|uniref:COG1470 family protein n=1 Tax=Clostridium sp. SHJSY1 TaxID=2942483 RepID=UPI00287400F5|nr:hypothetical protein [Clostridium sp. SHJSY1]MDS0524830.1 hypothetical protein [Clostridium sp. SHJSY1]
MIKIKKASLYLIVTLTFFIIFNSFYLISVNAIDNKPNNTIVRPVYANLGRITDNSINTMATVTNDGEASTFTANAEGNGSGFISFEPESFDLGKGESKQVKININNSDKLLPSPYDVTITFSRKIENRNDNGAVVYTSTSNSLRLQFVKEGFNVVSFLVSDINKLNVGAFHIILANYTEKEEELNTNISIISKEDNKEVANFNENLKTQTYPSNNYMGIMKFNWDTKNVAMGNYVAKYKAVKSDGKVVIQGEKDFSVGEMKGELESVIVKDTFQGKPAKILAKVKSTGNLDLPVIFDISIKNSNGEEVFKDEKQDSLKEGEEKTLESQWDTINAKVGEYTVDYTVKMGDQTQSDTIHFKVLGSYLLHIIIVSIIIILFILFVILAKRKKKIGESEEE